MSHDFRYTQDDILRGKAVPEILEQVRRWHSERFAWEAQG
jgi:hypothetical protein